jgi:hypothetical protein
MPRSASRITLEIVNVKVARVMEITADDIRKEGLSVHNIELSWDSLNAKRGYSFRSNPWVWVIEFKLIPPLAGSQSTEKP